MSSDKPKRQGFASLTPARHRKVSSKGGSARVPKGFAAQHPEQRKVNASNAAKARWAKVRAERLEQE